MNASVMTMAWIAPLRSTDKLVLLALASEAARSMVLGLTVGELCRMTSLSDRCVQNAMKRLEKAGYVHRHYIEGDVNAYELLSQEARA